MKDTYILERRKMDFEDEEVYVHHVVGDARRAAMLVLGRAVRDAIADDMVDDPKDIKFDLKGENISATGLYWSTECECRDELTDEECRELALNSLLCINE